MLGIMEKKINQEHKTPKRTRKLSIFRVQFHPSHFNLYFGGKLFIDLINDDNFHGRDFLNVVRLHSLKIIILYLKIMKVYSINF